MGCVISSRPRTADCSRSRKNSPPFSIPCGVPRATSRPCYVAPGIVVIFARSMVSTLSRQRHASTGGCLSRMQITVLFHGRLSSSRIEAALEQLILLGAIYPSSQPSGGRPSTLWSAIPESESLNKQESRDETATEETANEESMQGQT